MASRSWRSESLLDRKLEKPLPELKRFSSSSVDSACTVQATTCESGVAGSSPSPAGSCVWWWALELAASARLAWLLWLKVSSGVSSCLHRAAFSLLSPWCRPRREMPR